MFGKIWAKVGNAFGKAWRWMGMAARKLLDWLVVSFFVLLFLVFFLTGMGNLGFHVYHFLKSGEWPPLAASDFAQATWLQTEWIGAWKILNWLPASIICMALSFLVILSYSKLKKTLRGASVSEVTKAVEPSVVAGK